MDNTLQALLTMVKKSRRIAFFGGAGISTESAIPDFRSEGGLYAKKYRYSAEVMLSHRFFTDNTEAFYNFYREAMLYPDARPNAAHRILAAWEHAGLLSAVVTQNIDGLHQAAGSNRVFELHGSVHRNYCMDCRAFHPLSAILQSTGVPRCSCGGIIKPDVVLYEEGLNEQVVQDAVAEISHADMLLVGGTSLAVYPAAGLIRYYKGSRLALINLSPTPYDAQADVVLQGKIGDILTTLQGAMENDNGTRTE